ncbi:hypothetical protein TNCV_2466491 [Trichonephila clavipes]|nr:hypothetical protein TNCV_2466491 [Trichonephila clavipes]
MPSNFLRSQIFNSQVTCLACLRGKEAQPGLIDIFLRDSLQQILQLVYQICAIQESRKGLLCSLDSKCVLLGKELTTAPSRVVLKKYEDKQWSPVALCGWQWRNIHPRIEGGQGSKGSKA